MIQTQPSYAQPVAYRPAPPPGPVAAGGGYQSLLDRLSLLTHAPAQPQPQAAIQPPVPTAAARSIWSRLGATVQRWTTFDARHPVAEAARDVRTFFISQYQSTFNTREDAPRNGNCGPTSLTMVAKAFGKLDVTAASANAAIEDTRKRMGAGTSQDSEYEGTSYAQLIRGAQSYGLQAREEHGKLDVIKAELAKGRLVIAHVIPSYLNPDTRSRGHYAVVTKVEGGKVHLNDPARSAGPVVVSEAAFLEGQRRRGTYGMVSIGA